MNVKYTEVAQIEVEFISLQDSVDTCEVVTIKLSDRTVTYTIMYDRISEFKVTLNEQNRSSI
jgi:hypothetical protein